MFLINRKRVAVLKFKALEFSGNYVEPLFSISILPLTMVSQLLPFGTRTDGKRFKDTQVVPDFSDFTGRGFLLINVQRLC